MSPDASLGMTADATWGGAAPVRSTTRGSNCTWPSLSGALLGTLATLTRSGGISTSAKPKFAWSAFDHSMSLVGNADAISKDADTAPCSGGSANVSAVFKASVVGHSTSIRVTLSGEGAQNDWPAW